MRVLRLHAPRDLRMHDEPVPEPGPGEALIRIKSVGICASDLHYYRDGRIGSAVVTSPIVLGHEASGVIEKLGPQHPFPPLKGEAIGSQSHNEWEASSSPHLQVGHEYEVKPGDRVAIEPAKPCMRCEWCRSGHFNVCPGIPFFGTPPVDGCLREFVTWPARLCLKVPDLLSFDEIAMLEPLAIGLYAVELAEPKPDDVIAILGAGGIGLSVLAALKAAGVKRVIVSEPIEARRLAALRLGASNITIPSAAVSDIESLTGGRGCDVVIECTGEDDAVRQSARLARVLGKVLIVGIPSSDTYPFEASESRRKQLSAVFVRRSNLTTEKAIKLVSEGKINASVLATHRFPLERTADAMELAIAKTDGVIRAVITVSE